METLADSIQQDLNDQTSLQGDSPVKISARPDCVQDSQAPAAVSGESSSAFFAVLDTAHVLVENVAALRYLNRQSGTTEPAAIAAVLADLAGAGYDAEWTSLYAYQFGYPHCRERCFLVAYPDGLGLPPCFDDLPSCPKPLRPGTLSRLDWYRRLLEAFEHRVCQPAVFRSPPGFPCRPQRLRVLGNAVMPDMARLVGQCILRRETRMAALSADAPPHPLLTVSPSSSRPPSSV